MIIKTNYVYSLLIKFSLQVDISLWLFQGLNCDFSQRRIICNWEGHLHTSLVGKHFLVASWYKTLMISKVYIAKLLYGDQPDCISIQFQFIFICFIAYVHSGTYAIRQWNKKCVFVAIKYFISVHFLGIRLFTKLKLPRTNIFKLIFANCTFQIFISNSLECT